MECTTARRLVGRGWFECEQVANAALQGDAELLDRYQRRVVVLTGADRFEGGTRQAGQLGEPLVSHALASLFAVALHRLSKLDRYHVGLYLQYKISSESAAQLGALTPCGGYSSFV